MSKATNSTPKPLDQGWRISLATAGFAIAVGVFLRIYNLDLKGLWLDEIYSVYPLYSLSSFSSLWADYMATDSNSPFYEMVLLAWTSIFGYSDLAVRMPNAILGILAVVAIFLVAKAALNRSVAISATILLAFSWPAIFYSQEVRS
jgi:mannosyltransferase